MLSIFFFPFDGLRNVLLSLKEKIVLALQISVLESCADHRRFRLEFLCSCVL